MVVVLPASMCAMIPMLRYLSRGTSRLPAWIGKKGRQRPEVRRCCRRWAAPPHLRHCTPHSCLSSRLYSQPGPFVGPSRRWEAQATHPPSQPRETRPPGELSGPPPSAAGSGHPADQRDNAQCPSLWLPRPAVGRPATCTPASAVLAWPEVPAALKPEKAGTRCCWEAGRLTTPAA